MIVDAPASVLLRGGELTKGLGAGEGLVGGVCSPPLLDRDAVPVAEDLALVLMDVEEAGVRGRNAGGYCASYPCQGRLHR